MVIKRSPSRPLVLPSVSSGKTVRAMALAVGFFFEFFVVFSWRLAAVAWPDAGLSSSQQRASDLVAE